jgi:predicted dehydrogenase
MENAMSRSTSRRTFLLTTSAAVATAVRRTRAASPNEKLTVGLVGCGGQGRYDTRSLIEAGGKDVAWAAIADIDDRHLHETAGEAEKLGFKPERYKDYRKLIDRKDIDIVVVGTPDHWHAPVALLACQAEKDVYVEKPLAHNIAEGRAMVEAARKYKRIVQVGQQQRSDAHFREAMDYLHKGDPLGVISRTETFNFGNETPGGIGNPPDGQPPKEADYDMWLGAAPLRPFNPNRFHYQWRWFFDYAGGMICDWNVHIMDIVHWGMKVTAPLSVYATGGKRVLTDNRETPDIMDVVYEYKTPEGKLFTQVYTMGKCYQRGSNHPEGYGTEFFGTSGAMFINRGGWRVSPEMKRTRVDDPDNPGKKKTVEGPRTPAIQKPGGDSVPPHSRNFLECVRSRKAEDLHCPVQVGHHIAAACHLGNIALRLEKKIWWNAEKELITLQDGTPDTAANVHLTREYRKGYELPQV